MSDYISRDALLNSTSVLAVYSANEDIVSYGVSFDTIRDFPAADVAPVEVVRCKDCKFYQSYGRTSLLVDGKNIKAGWCNRRIRYDEEYRMLPDDFCSYGERKEDE